MCELPCTVIVTVKKGNIVYIMHEQHDVSPEILILDTVPYMIFKPFMSHPGHPDKAMILN